ncbi:hypothetical protein TorRG33x02_047450 [Trema orientale]|uniref:Uncharacterized protein n=1 Tax=Trema orientale TaxID=63057 RepID=A0A2P5FP56_TREOI|nr:hypothetical protein TorRG33x02_047450 [Trema orientale]
MPQIVVIKNWSDIPHGIDHYRHKKKETQYLNMHIDDKSEIGSGENGVDHEPNPMTHPHGFVSYPNR